MKTRTYDLNLYVIDGRLKVLAHEMEISSDGDVQSLGGTFHEILNIPVLRGNRRQWENILEFFEESEMYDELDAWWCSPVEDIQTPVYDYDLATIRSMPGELQYGLATLPEYEMKDWR